MSFCNFESELALCSGDKVLIFNTATTEEKHLQLPKPAHPEEPRHNNEDQETCHSTTIVTFSNDGEYLAVCTKRKQLCLFHRKTLQLLANRTLVRAASKIRFTPKNDIVVADRTGDVYLYSTTEPEKKPDLLLGHLSMLLDVMVTNDNKHIISADRDEKIRVSMFPNSYNIVSYCLGHTKFVTNIAELPKEGFLISGGGDGYLRIWNYKTGTEMMSINYAEKFLQEDVENFNERLKNHDVEEIEVSMPVKQLRIGRMEKGSFLVLLSFYSSRKMFVYKFLEGEFKGGWDVCFLDELEVDEEPLDCILIEGKVWVLTERDVLVYEIKENGFCRNEEPALKKLSASWQKLRNNVNSVPLFPVLYKRKYDNIKDYQERKKLRLDKCN